MIRLVIHRNTLYSDSINNKIQNIEMKGED